MSTAVKTKKKPVATTAQKPFDVFGIRAWYNKRKASKAKKTPAATNGKAESSKIGTRRPATPALSNGSTQTPEVVTSEGDKAADKALEELANMQPAAAPVDIYSTASVLASIKLARSDNATLEQILSGLIVTLSLAPYKEREALARTLEGRLQRRGKQLSSDDSRVSSAAIFSVDPEGNLTRLEESLEASRVPVSKALAPSLGRIKTSLDLFAAPLSVEEEASATETSEETDTEKKVTEAPAAKTVANIMDLLTEAVIHSTHKALMIEKPAAPAAEATKPAEPIEVA